MDLPGGASRRGQIDPITFEVLRNAFMSVVDEMGLMLERVAHSLVVSEGRDFSAAICDGDGRMVAEGKEDLPAHVGTLPYTVKAVISWLGKETLKEGDIVIMNDAFLGGTHAQDVRTIMPVYRDGEIVAFVQNSAHWSDAGGPVPGSFMPRRRPRTARRSPSHLSTSCARASSTARSCGSSSGTSAYPRPRRATCSRRWLHAGPARHVSSR